MIKIRICKRNPYYEFRRFVLSFRLLSYVCNHKGNNLGTIYKLFGMYTLWGHTMYYDNDIENCKTVFR